MISDLDLNFFLTANLQQERHRAVIPRRRAIVAIATGVCLLNWREATGWGGQSDCCHGNQCLPSPDHEHHFHLYSPFEFLSSTSHRGVLCDTILAKMLIAIIKSRLCHAAKLIEQLIGLLPFLFRAKWIKSKWNQKPVRDCGRSAVDC